MSKYVSLRRHSGLVSTLSTYGSIPQSQRLGRGYLTSPSRHHHERAKLTAALQKPTYQRYVIRPFRPRQREIESMRLSIELPPKIRNDSNDMSETDIHRTLTTIIDHHLSTHASILDTACNLSQAVLQKVDGAYRVTTHMRLPKRQCPAGLETMEIGIEAISPIAYNREEDVFFITVESQSKLHIRLEGQKERHLHHVEFELSWITPRAYAPPDQRASAIISGGSDAESRDPVPTFSIHCQLANLIEGSTHVSYDSLAAAAARVAFQSCEATIIAPQRVCGIFIKLSEVRSTDKPEAYPLAREFYYFNAQKFADLQRARRDNAPFFGRSRAFIALGSNVGDRTKMMEDALLEMGRRDLKVLRTSSLYETEPMYKTDQPPFMNGVCEIETALSPMELLDQLKDIEKLLGRVKTIENGPRAIDLDILLYGNEIIDEPRLQIPHPRISEREFVLRPLCDLIPHSYFPMPNILQDFSSQLARLPPPTFPLSPFTPLKRSTSALSPAQSILANLPTRHTHLMEILNLTPDSFSHDGVHTPSFDPTTLHPLLTRLLAAKPAPPILDIGGQSTRPHATPLSAADELARVLPTIEYIRSNPAFNPLILSIDTFHAPVARACIQAGADIVNDISAGTMDKDMLPTVAELGCSYIMMHTRGTPQTMHTLTSYPEGIIPGIATELLSRVAAAQAAGIRRWRIILDPGIGFAKTAKQNLEVLRRLGELRAWEGLVGLPWCVGVSKKGFVGRVSGCEEGDVEGRGWGTSAAVTACVQGGADVVRVHDWEGMGKVVRMGEGVWRV